MKCAETQPMEEGALSSEACHLSLEAASSRDDGEWVCFTVACDADHSHGHKEDTGHKLWALERNSARDGQRDSLSGLQWLDSWLDKALPYVHLELSGEVCK